MATGLERPSKWVPMTGLDLIDAAHLGKLGEEAGELIAIISRIWIQGIDERDPDTGKVNRLALQEEIADNMAMIDLIIQRFDLDLDAITLRRQRKADMKRAWHDMLKE